MEELNLLLNGDFNFKRFDKSNVKGIDHINKRNIDIDAKLLERVQNVFLRDNVDFTDHLWEILLSKLLLLRAKIDYIYIYIYTLINFVFF